MTPPHSAVSQRPFGLVEWFRPGEYERAEMALEGILATGATMLRTHLSWADYLAPDGRQWYDWLIPTLGSRIELLPCLHFTPPSLSRTGRTSGPPRRPRDFADFTDHVLTRYGEHFPHVELWNEPNNLLDWDWREDADWDIYSDMIGAAAYWAERRGWRAVLGGPCPLDLKWLALMGERGVLKAVSAVGLHGFPGTWDSEAAGWGGWDSHLAAARAVIQRCNPAAELWITEAGYSTWKHDEVGQVRRFLEALAAPADRLYWYGWQDIAQNVPVQEGLLHDLRHYSLGIAHADGRPKLLGRLLQDGGARKAQATAALATPAVAKNVRPVVILGGAGFIGSNLADDLLTDGNDVVIVDALARPGVEENLAWLQDRHADRLTSVLADIRDAGAIEPALADASAVFHFAAQVAVTTSLANPADDFSVNAEGTLRVLEAVRRRSARTPVIFSSTNKVYGALEHLEMMTLGECYFPVDGELRAHGIGEGAALNFCTPYGCSKGVADQYVLDYAKSFGLPTAVLRMSCIYGPRQFGTEDQGWVAHFLLRAMSGEPITIYGDGKQVRDILHVRDAVAAYRGILGAIEAVKGQAFNLGGGPANAVSLRMVLQEIEQIMGMAAPVVHAEWRTGDQFYFVSDTRKLEQQIGWHAHVGWREGMRDLANWISRLRGGFQAVQPGEPERLRA